MIGATKEISNTFYAGMNYDSDVRFLQQGEYIDADNISIMINNQQDSKSIQAVIGNKKVNLVGPDEIKGNIIGATSIVDYLVVFTETYSGDYTDENIIYRLEDDKAANSCSVHKIASWRTSDEFSLCRKDRSRTSELNRLSLVGNFENDDVVKIYYADGIHPLCFVDVTNASRNKYPYHILPFNTLGLNIESINKGLLEDGIYEYAYQTYIKNGSQSRISPLTPAIPINKADDRSGAVLLSVRPPDSLQDGMFVRIFALYRKDSINSPEVSIIYDDEITTSHISIDHSSSKGHPTLDYSEFLAINGQLIIPSCIHGVNGYLTAGGIKYVEFGRLEGYDARAYAVAKDRTGKDVWDEIGYFNPATKEVKYASITKNSFDEIAAMYGKDFLPLSVADTIRESANQRSNKLEDFDAYGDYNYHATEKLGDGSHPYGGVGKNIEYKIITTPLLEDLQTQSDVAFDNKFSDLKSGLNNIPSKELIDYIENGATYSYGTASAAKTYDLRGTSVKKIKGIYAGDSFGLDYSNPVVSAKLRGFQHDSVYNIGIVFRDRFGDTSSVKHIAVVRFPSAIDKNYSQFKNHYAVKNGSTKIGNYALLSFPLGIEVTIKNWPAGAISAQIVYKERNIQARNVVHQGVATNLFNSSQNAEGTTALKARLPIHPTVSDIITYYGNAEMNQFTSLVTYCAIKAGSNDSKKTLAFFCPDYDYGNHHDGSNGKSLSLLGALHAGMSYSNRFFCGINVSSGDRLFSPEIVNSYPFQTFNSNRELLYAKRLRPEKGINHMFLKMLSSNSDDDMFKHPVYRETTSMMTPTRNLSLVFKLFNLADTVYISTSSARRLYGIYSIIDSVFADYEYTPGDNRSLSEYKMILTGEEWNSARGLDSEATQSYAYSISPGVENISISNSSGSRDSYHAHSSIGGMSASTVPEGYFFFSYEYEKDKYWPGYWPSSIYEISINPETGEEKLVRKGGGAINKDDRWDGGTEGADNSHVTFPCDRMGYQNYNFTIFLINRSGVDVNEFWGVESGAQKDADGQWVKDVVVGKTLYKRAACVMRFTRFSPQWSYTQSNNATSDGMTVTGGSGGVEAMKDTFVACFVGTLAPNGNRYKPKSGVHNATAYTWATNFVGMNQDFEVPTTDGSAYNGKGRDDGGNASIMIELHHAGASGDGNNHWFVFGMDNTGNTFGGGRPYEGSVRLVSDGGFDPAGAGGRCTFLYAEDSAKRSPHERLSGLTQAGKRAGDSAAFRSGFAGFDTFNDFSQSSVLPSINITANNQSLSYGVSASLAQTSVAIASIKSQLSYGTMMRNISDKYLATGEVFVRSGNLTDVFATFGGDVFPCINSHIYTHFQYSQKTTPMEADPMASSMYFYYPCESSINPYMADDTMATNGSLSLEYQSAPYVSPRTSTKYKTPAYPYNAVFSSIGSQVHYVEDIHNLREFQTRIMYAGPKINNEDRDKWLNFKALDFIDIDGFFGGINALFAHDNTLYSISDNAVYGISAGERALSSTSGGEQLLLGSGDYFKNHYMLSNTYGVKRNDGCGLLNMKDYSVWYDRDKHAIVRFENKSILPISISQNIHTFISEFTFPDYTKFVYEYGNKDFLMCGGSRKGKPKLIKHNDLFDKFVSTEDSADNTEYIQSKNGLFSVKTQNPVELWRERSGDICSIFGEKRRCNVLFSSIAQDAKNAVYDYTVIPDMGLSLQADAGISKRASSMSANSEYERIYLRDTSAEPRQLREHFYYVPVGRSGELDHRLRGMNLMQNLWILPDDKANFNIPYITTTYRQSNV